MNGIILFVLVILLSANQISAYCFNSLPPTGPPGFLLPAVCTYKGRTYSPGEAWDTDNCEECQCDKDGGLSCCGYGFPAGLMDFGDGCDLYQLDCLNGIIQDKDGISTCERAGEYIELKRN
ncbi:prostate-associated microseminoprotein-like [Mizuhopecten yessoensis]|uniref:prostate-associated microseminoprotein-like n=1 Tax=Mizuhopecten yessoensis TaxID=6573 RepID=UPI000B4586BA|nr:prostate-associated microseminoprotein-like [Mizuhopecten yessoensis]